MNNENESLKELLEKINKELSTQLLSISQRQERLEVEFSKLSDKIIIREEIPKSSIPAKRLLSIFTEALQQLQKEVAEAPGMAKFSIGTFSPLIRATITYDDKGEIILNLPQPGDPTPPELLSDIKFDINPLPWDPSIAADEVLVPSLVGLSLEHAKAQIEKLGLKVGNVVTEKTELSSGIVLKQDPAAGRVVLTGNAINLVVSESILVEVPLVVGMAIADAKKVFEKLDLGYKIRSEIESDQPAGQILNQEPPAGEHVPVKTVVLLDISRGKTDQVQVPGLTGKSVEEATRILNKAQLKMGAVEYKESESRSGTVISQNPSAGSMVDKNTIVSLDVSHGLLVVVPSVFGLQYDVANAILKSLGLKASIKSEISSKKPPGEILSQEPAAGQRVEKQSTVLLVISKKRVTRKKTGEK